MCFILFPKIETMNKPDKHSYVSFWIKDTGNRKGESPRHSFNQFKNHSINQMLSKVCICDVTVKNDFSIPLSTSGLYTVLWGGLPNKSSLYRIILEMFLLSFRILISSHTEKYWASFSTNRREIIFTWTIYCSTSLNKQRKSYIRIYWPSIF